MVDVHPADFDELDDEASLTRLFASVNQALRRRLRRLLGNQADADEVAQEAWLRVWRHRGRIRDNPEGLLFITALNLASQRRQAYAARPTVAFEEGEAEQLPDVLTPEHWLASRQELELVAREFNQMPPVYQQIVLASLDGEGQTSMADRLGLSQATVSRYLQKAMKAFQRAQAGGRQQDATVVPIDLHKKRG